MRVLSLTDLPCADHPGHVVTIGSFDGIHVAHQAILRELRSLARRLGVPSAVVTFRVPPKYFIRKEPPALLTTWEERVPLYRRFGVHEVLLLDFDDALMDTPADVFLHRFLVQGLRARWVVIGFNHRFGRNREGGPEFLARYVEPFNFGLTLLPPLTVDGLVVSSSMIRKLLREGQVARAARLLGYFYTVRGRVYADRGLGARTLVPTANVRVPPEKLLPAPGVYAVFLRVGRQRYPAVANLGTSPTVQERSHPVLEVHVPGHHLPLVRRTVEVAFVERLRGERRFPDLRALREQIQRDIETALTLLAGVQDPAKGPENTSD